MAGNSASKSKNKLTYDQFGQHLSALAAFVRSQFAGVYAPRDAYSSVMKGLVENEHQIEKYVQLAIEQQADGRITIADQIGVQENDIKRLLAIWSANIVQRPAVSEPNEQQQELGHEALMFLAKHEFVEHVVSMRGNLIGLKVSHHAFKTELNGFCKLTTEYDPEDIDDDVVITTGVCDKTAFRFTIEEDTERHVTYFRSAPLSMKAKKKSPKAKAPFDLSVLSEPLREIIKRANVADAVGDGAESWAILNMDYDAASDAFGQVSTLKEVVRPEDAPEQRKGKTDDDLKFRITEFHKGPGGGTRVELRGETKNPAKSLTKRFKNMATNTPAQRMEKLLNLFGISRGFVTLNTERFRADVEKRSGVLMSEMLDIIGGKNWSTKGAGDHRIKCKFAGIKFELLDVSDTVFRITLRKESTVAK